MFEGYKVYFKNRCKKLIDESLNDLEKEIIINTPTDTRVLIGNNKINQAKVTGNTIAGEVYNDTEYAGYVEYGIGNKAYNYHKGPPRDDTTIFYSGVGCRFFTRSYDNLKSKILNRFKG